MDVRFWILLVGIAGVVVTIVWWKRRARRVFTIDHVCIELHDARIVDDRVIEAVWHAAISMTNNSRRPRALPVFAERATVRAGHRVYLASVYLDADVSEISPGDVALAWVEFALPADVVPRRCDIVQLRAAHSNRSYRLAVRAAGIMADRHPRTRVRVGLSGL